MKKEVFKKELSYIKNERLKNSANNIIETLPNYFFKIAASSTGKYHPKFTLNEGGLIRHTKVAVKIANELLNNNTTGSDFTSLVKDLIILTLLIHDGFKKGFIEEKYTRFDHPLIVSNYILENYKKFNLKLEEATIVSKALASHMGEWNKNPYSNFILPLPETKLEKFVHLCDYLSSRKFINVEFNKNEIID